MDIALIGPARGTMQVLRDLPTPVKGRLRNRFAPLLPETKPVQRTVSETHRGGGNLLCRTILAFGAHETDSDAAALVGLLQFGKAFVPGC